MIHDSAGVLFVATNHQKYVEQACRSARSARLHMNDVRLALATNLDIAASPSDVKLFDHIVYIDSRLDSTGLAMADKVCAFSRSPFTKTIYLDTDTFVLDSLYDIFEILEVYPLVFTHGHNRVRRDEMAREAGIIGKAFPYGFCPIQGGLMAFNTEAVMARQFVEEICGFFLEAKYFDDQAIIRKFLWEKRSPLYILPPEYNISSWRRYVDWRRGRKFEATPKVFHYAFGKKLNGAMERAITSKSRIWEEAVWVGLQAYPLLSRIRGILS
jgi:hypothetical protein